MLFVLGQEDNFKKYSHAEADILGVQYDYASVMHYGSRSFSKNGKETMKPIRETSHKLGIATELSALDVVQLNALYDCHSKLMMIQMLFIQMLSFVLLIF